MRWLRNLWYARMRRIDMKVLWPACVRYSTSMEQARATFTDHALNDKAWTVLGPDAVKAIIDGLVGEKR